MTAAKTSCSSPILAAKCILQMLHLYCIMIYSAFVGPQSVINFTLYKVDMFLKNNKTGIGHIKVKIISKQCSTK